MRRKSSEEKPANMADEAARLAEEQAIEMFKIKKLIKSLERAKG